MSTVLYIFGFDPTSSKQSSLRSTLEASVGIIASKRLYENLLKLRLTESYPPLIPVVPLAKCIEITRELLKKGDVIVLASGDPFFFGIGRKLTESFPDQKTIVSPEISSMQLAFARFNLPWDDAWFVSLHGRSNKQLASKLLQHSKTFVLTDPKNSPDYIAHKLLEEYGEKAVSMYSMHVAEHLGFSSEQIFSGTFAQIASQKFADPNVMIIIKTRSKKQMYPDFGLQEHEICHSRGLLTKNEVRAAAIHALRLPARGVFWDVGAGSGSVGLEVARLHPELQVLAIEKKSEQWQNIKDNQKKFAVWNMRLIQGEAPDALQQLDNPDRVFIGGSGGNLKNIIEFCAEKLLINGIIVVNAVIKKTAKIAPEVLYSLGFEVEIREITVKRNNYPNGEIEMFNPIKIIVGHKKSQEPDDEQ